MRDVPDQSDERGVALSAVASGSLRPPGRSRVGCDFQNPPFRLGASPVALGDRFENTPRDYRRVEDGDSLATANKAKLRA